MFCLVQSLKLTSQFLTTFAGTESEGSSRSSFRRTPSLLRMKNGITSQSCDEDQAAEAAHFIPKSHHKVKII